MHRVVAGGQEHCETSKGVLGRWRGPDGAPQSSRHLKEEEPGCVRVCVCVCVCVRGGEREREKEREREREGGRRGQCKEDIYVFW